MTPRRRGRPAGSGRDTREHILAVARAQLAAQGFAATSLRAIAREAGVDPSLISHYFDGKAGLLVATLELPFDPLTKIRPALSGDPRGTGIRLITAFLTAWDPHRDTFSALLRSTFGPDDPAIAPLVEVAQNIVTKDLSAAMEGADRELRATLAAAQIIGMAALRYVARVEPVATAPIEVVARWYGPAIQSLLIPAD